jgi:hypothetical protein
MVLQEMRYHHVSRCHTGTWTELSLVPILHTGSRALLTRLAAVGQCQSLRGSMDNPLGRADILVNLICLLSAADASQHSVIFSTALRAKYGLTSPMLQLD